MLNLSTEKRSGQKKHAYEYESCITYHLDNMDKK
jgi:hypothetical protein